MEVVLKNNQGKNSQNRLEHFKRSMPVEEAEDYQERSKWKSVVYLPHQEIRRYFKIVSPYQNLSG